MQGNFSIYNISTFGVKLECNLNFVVSVGEEKKKKKKTGKTDINLLLLLLFNIYHTVLYWYFISRSNNTITIYGK